MAGWVVAVLVELPGEAGPVRSYFGVGEPERARAEWLAIDAAALQAPVASSPFKGQEPVEALVELKLARMKILGLKPGEVRSLGVNWPRRWMHAES